jgi:hypothetical protein
VTTWDTYIINQLKTRDNVDPDEAMIGDVISINPITVSILDGQVILTDGINCSIGESLKSITGQILIDGGVTTNFTITRTLSIDDRVLCLPYNKGQNYVIVEKV